MVNRLFVQKHRGLDVESPALLRQIKEFLQIDAVDAVQVYNGYDVEGLSELDLKTAIDCVFSEPNADIVTTDIALADEEVVILYKLLPGQYDQRADSAKQCLAILGLGSSVGLQTFKAVVLKGKLTADIIKRVKGYLINPVEAVEISRAVPLTTAVVLPTPEKTKRYEGFLTLTNEALEMFIKTEGLAMNLADLASVQSYFKAEGRVPTHTEIKVLDTYWSDHCRHTTFTTELTQRHFEGNTESTTAQIVLDAQKAYEAMRTAVYGQRAQERSFTLMDLATINAKYLKKQGLLTDVLESEEINAATFETEVTLLDGTKVPYWVLFKNETHNHPTEIEPFGGAATCLGGAIRDPLSGRAYVYQGMRITGAADPRASLEETLAGKLPQRVITRGAARGFSSYGNQIGLSTGFVREYYHDGFLAKRMEVGAVIGAVPKEQVRRESPSTGDIVLLIGGKTGIDGCGGATGSSKEHDEASLETCASEVQRGNAPEERKLQRLFSRADFAALVKKSNDFGAGGVSVAVGELADSLNISLDAVRTKYEGLDGTQLAISESQERMAVVIEAKDAEKVIAISAEENLEAYQVAVVTDDGYLRMYWNGEEILAISRAFIETNGAARQQVISVALDSIKEIEAIGLQNNAYLPSEAQIKALVTDLNYCSQEGLVEMFDNSIGALSVHMPFGGTYQKTPTQAMVSRIPAYGQEVLTATVMAAGYKPKLTADNPFVGGAMATVEALAKLVAVGGKVEQVKFSMQEYFEKLGDDPEKWAKPYLALLGSAHALRGLSMSAIGGKDSMSGTFKDIAVPPTLIAFAASVQESAHTVSPEFKAPDQPVYIIDFERDALGLPNFQTLRKSYEVLNQLMSDGCITAAMALEEGGLLGSLIKMSFGNQIGFEALTDAAASLNWTTEATGSLVFSTTVEAVESTLWQNLKTALGESHLKCIGRTSKAYQLQLGSLCVALNDIQSQWEAPLADVFPRAMPVDGEQLVCGDISSPVTVKNVQVLKGKKPKVFIPAFPGTNCELDTARAFERAGAETEVIVFKNKNDQDVLESLKAFTRAASEAQMIALPGGFSAGDEPDGSGKFICSVFRNPQLAEAVMKMLKERDGLMIGICNGFQALVKLGLVTYGEIRTLEEDAPTLTYNTAGKHISKIVSIESVANRSPWLSLATVGESYQVPLSHGEGRFVCTDTWFERLKANGQLATFYQAGSNLNDSMHHIEGITSPDGKVLGKMGHAERIGTHIYANVPGRYDMEIFEAGIRYFT